MLSENWSDSHLKEGRWREISKRKCRIHLSVLGYFDDFRSGAWELKVCVFDTQVNQSTKLINFEHQRESRMRILSVGPPRTGYLYNFVLYCFKIFYLLISKYMIKVFWNFCCKKICRKWIVRGYFSGTKTRQIFFLKTKMH